VLVLGGCYFFGRRLGYLFSSGNLTLNHPSHPSVVLPGLPASCRFLVRFSYFSPSILNSLTSGFAFLFGTHLCGSGRNAVLPALCFTVCLVSKELHYYAENYIKQGVRGILHRRHQIVRDGDVAAQYLIVADDRRFVVDDR